MRIVRSLTPAYSDFQPSFWIIDLKLEFEFDRMGSNFEIELDVCCLVLSTSKGCVATAANGNV